MLRNPIGRTGITGRGLLGRFGPNHAADSIITRWEHDSSGEILKINGKPVLEFIAIKRQDGNEVWAIPGVSKKKVIFFYNDNSKVNESQVIREMSS